MTAADPAVEALIPAPAEPEPAQQPSVPTTARAVDELLRRHYITDERHPAWLTATEIQAPQSGRRADFVALGMSTAVKGRLVGHEVKVTRSDVMVELADLTKSDPWMRFCDQWYLVIPHLSLIEGLELPDTWGVMLPPAGRRTRSMTVHRRAPKLSPVDKADAVTTLAAWQHWKIRDLRNNLADRDQQVERLERANQELRIHQPRHDPRRDVVARIVHELAGRWGSSTDDKVGGWECPVSVDDVVDALRDLGGAYRRRDDALLETRHTRNKLVSMHASLARVIAELDQYQPAADTGEGPPPQPQIHPYREESR